MKRTEATAIMTAELAKYEALQYHELVAMIDAPKIISDAVGPSGVRYTVEVRVRWDGRPHSDIRVSCSVDDGGVRAFLPLAGDFLKEPPN